MIISHYRTVNNDVVTITLFSATGEVTNVNSNHIHFSEIEETLSREPVDYSQVAELLDAEERINLFVESNSDYTISIKGRTVMLNDESIEGELAFMLINAYKAKNHYAVNRICNFIQKASKNPGGISSINSLWTWITQRNFTILDNGNFIAYKGVQRKTSDGKTQYVSIHAGDGEVDGVQYFKTHLPNNVGSFVRMPREKVETDTGRGCSHGLHAGSWQYAYSFARSSRGVGVVLAVEINPQDVVSVPSDSHFQKLRVCEYKVVAVASQRLESDESEKEEFYV